MKWLCTSIKKKKKKKKKKDQVFLVNLKTDLCFSRKIINYFFSISYNYIVCSVYQDNYF